MAKPIQTAVADLAAAIKDSDELKDPVFPKLADALTRFAKEFDALKSKAKTAQKQALSLNDEIDEAYEMAKKEKSNRTSDLKKAYDKHMDFVTCLHALAGGNDLARKFAPSGETVHKVLDKLEFSDKKKVAKFRQAAKAYYTTESALVKSVETWAVRADQVGKALKASLGKLNPKDPVSKVHAKFIQELQTRLEGLVKSLKG